MTPLTKEEQQDQATIRTLLEELYMAETLSNRKSVVIVFLLVWGIAQAIVLWIMTHGYTIPSWVGW